MGQSAVVYRDPAVYYAFSFDIGAAVPALTTALALLDTDIGIATALSGTDDVLVATRYRALEESLREMRAVEDEAALIRTQPRLAFLRWFIQNPFLAVTQMREAADHDLPPAVETVAQQREELEQFLNDSMHRAQFLAVLGRHSDESLYSPIYLDEMPFTRVDLQAADFSTPEGKQVGADVTLLVHRSGVGILTFHCQFEGDFDHESLVRISSAGGLMIDRIRMPACLADHQAQLAGLPRDETGGTRLFQEIEWWEDDDTGWTLVDVFEHYRRFITDAVGKVRPKRKSVPTSGWLCYPVVIVRSTTPSIGSVSEAATTYREPLLQLLLRESRTEVFRDPLLHQSLESDVADVRGYSLFLQGSHAVLLYYGTWWNELPRNDEKSLPDGGLWIPRDFSAIAPVEHLLLQRWIVEVGRARLLSAAQSGRKLHEIRSQVGDVLDELVAIAPVQYGTLQDIIERGRREMGITQSVGALREQLSWLESASSAEESRVQVARESRSKVVTTLLTLVFALPAAFQTVEFLQRWLRLPSDAYLGLAVS